MYTLAFYENMVIQPTYFTLPKVILDNINALHLHMGVQHIPIKPKTPENPSRRHRQESNELWKKKEEFKATVIVKKEGYESCIGELKKYLNKLTTTNYDTQIESIIETINSVMLIELDETKMNECILGMVDILVQVACNNKYYSALYAQVYERLCDLQSQILDDKPRIYHKLINSLHDIEVGDPTVDYDRFCEITKKNDERRAFMLFVINVYKIGGYDMQQIKHIVNTLCGMIHSSIHDVIRVEYVNELTEMMNMFVTNMVDEIKTQQEWSFVKDQIVEYSKYKTKDYPGMSSRTIFKYMDMVDLFK